MSGNLLTDIAWVPVLALAAAAVSSIARSLVSLCKKMVEEKARTARFNTALKDSTPQQRAEIILACGQLERGRSNTMTTEQPEETPPPSPEKSLLVARILRGWREAEPAKE